MSNQITKISENTLRSLAEGLFQYHEKIASQPHQYLSQYPPLLQLSINNLNLVGLLNGGPLIKGIPEFVSDWARKPLEDWGLPIEYPDNEWQEAVLVEEDGQISSFCLEIKSNPNATGNFQKEIIDELMAKCQKNKQLYTDCRKFLIEHPTITHGKLQQKKLAKFSDVQDILERCYELAPLSYQYEGLFYKCSCCKGLMYLNKNNKLLCENRQCKGNTDKPQVIKQLPAGENLLWLKRDLRYFIHYPGIAELFLQKELSKMGLRVILYPDLDKYDLQITFPDQTIWAVDVKSWRLARELARNLIKNFDANSEKEVIPQIPDSRHEKSFFVFPDEITPSTTEYKNEFLRIISGSSLDSQIKESQVFFLKEFLQKVKDQLTSIEANYEK
jgi:hypothetical protein